DRVPSQNGNGQGQERRVAPLPPQPGPPAANLPNLDDLRTRRNSGPVQAQRPIPSTMRSRRKSAQPPTQSNLPPHHPRTGLRRASFDPSMLLLPQGAGYSYRRTITLDHNEIPNSDLANFPVLISGAYSYLATTTNGGQVQNANGYDVIFSLDSGCA